MFAALCGQGVGVVGIRVAPLRVVLELPGGWRVVGVVGVVGTAYDVVRDGPELGLDRVGSRCVGRRQAWLDVLAARVRVVGVLFAERLSMIT